MLHKAFLEHWSTRGYLFANLEGDAAILEVLMARILRDVRHNTLAILREGEVPFASFNKWNMAYISATRTQVARWAGISGVVEELELDNDVGKDQSETEQFARDILALLEVENPTTN